MQQIHSWFVGFGVSQFEQWWNSETCCIPCISTLEKTYKVRIIHTTYYNFEQAMNEYKTQLQTEQRPRTYTQSCVPLLCQAKEKKVIFILKHSRHSCSSLLSAPGEGWSVIQDNSAVLGVINKDIKPHVFVTSRSSSNCLSWLTVI